MPRHGNFRKARDSTRSPKKKKKQKGPTAAMRSSQTGAEGERLVQWLFPKLHYTGTKGSDFFYVTRYGKFHIEVKTTSHSKHTPQGDLKDHILLKTRNTAWVNNLAHYVIFVTPEASFVGRASEIRSYVRQNFERLKKMNPENNGITKVFVSIKDLHNNGVLLSFPNDPKIARPIFSQFMREEHKEAMRQQNARRIATKQASRILELKRSAPANHQTFAGRNHFHFPRRINPGRR